MLDVVKVTSEITEELEALEFEISTLARVFKEDRFFGDSGNFRNAHYGYLMACMGKIDILSSYWLGQVSSRGQTSRMISFMDRYLYPGRTEEHRVAVQMFRHTLMHTGALRFLYDRTTDTRYTWRVRFDGQLPPTWHYKITTEDSQYQDQLLAASASTGSSHSVCKALNLEISLFAGDISKAAQLYLADLARDSSLQSNYNQAHPLVIIQEFAS